MSSIELLHNTVTQAIESGRLGTAVFVRLVVECPAAWDSNVPIASRLAGLAAGWLTSDLATIYASGTEQSLNLSIECRSGATALVSCARSAEAGSAALVLMGTQGVADSLGLAVDFAAADGADGDEGLMSLIRVSLKQNDRQAVGAAQPPQAEASGIRGVPVEAESSANLASGQPVTPRPTEPPSRRSKPYGVLLVTGSETHQENYAASFANDQRCRLIALSDEPGVDQRRSGLNRRLAEQFDLPYVEDLATALQHEDVDLVSICSEPERRGRVIRQAAEAGKHLYLDKSFVPSLSDARALAKLVEAKHLLSHMFCFITQPWAQAARECLRQRQLGNLVALHVDMHFAKGHPGTADLSKRRRESYPPAAESFQTTAAKRELDNVGVYAVALILWLTARQVRSVNASTSNYFFREHQESGAEDFGVLNCLLEGGLTATVTASRCGWKSHPAGGINQVRLVGSRATHSFGPHRSRLQLYSNLEPWKPPPPNPDDPMAFWSSTTQASGISPKLDWFAFATGSSDAAYFIDCLDQGSESEMSVATAARVTEVLMAGYKSAAAQQVVSLPLEG